MGTRFSRRVGDELTRAIAAQNCCTTSVTIRCENCAITRLRSPSQHGNLAGPGSQPDSAPIAAPTFALRARLRDDRRLLNQRAQTT